jgi:hypothetical protein
MTLPPIHVTVPYDPPPELHAVFYEQLGVVPTIVRADQERGADNLPVYVIMATPVAIFLKSLLEAMGNRAGTALGTVLEELLRPSGPAGRPPEVRLVDEQRRITIVIPVATSEDRRASAVLVELPAESLKDGTLLRWDPNGVWRSS